MIERISVRKSVSKSGALKIYGLLQRNHLSLPLFSFFNRNSTGVIFLLSSLEVTKLILHSIINRINLLETRHTWRVERKDKQREEAITN